jgi:uncharacterized protein (DUF1786 family)
MEQEQLIKLVVSKAIGYLEYDDAHPDVGMGMWVDTAVDLAEKSVFKEAARWNSLQALALNFEDIREEVRERVIMQRN